MQTKPESNEKPAERRPRDMTQADFDAACAQYGFVKSGVLGYYRITPNVRVSIRNAGTRRRDQLAYLIQQRAKQEAEATR